MKYRILLIALCAAFVAFVTYFPVTDTDIWWHLAAGREMMAHKRLLYADPFAFTLDRPPWINLHWLFQLVSYGVFKAGGCGALVAMKCALTAAACALACACVPSRRFAALCAFAYALLIYEARYLVLVRPVIITLGCMAVFLLCFERYRVCRRWGRLWLLIPVQILWANCQGLFALGPAIAVAYACGEALDRLVAARRNDVPISFVNVWDKKQAQILALLIAAGFANPYLWQGCAFPWRLFLRIMPLPGNSYSQFVSENVPLLSLSGIDRRFLHSVTAVTLLLAVSFFLNRRRMTAAHVFLCGGFLLLAFMAQRNILLYFFVAAPVLAANLSASDVWKWAAGLHPGLRRCTTAVLMTVAFWLLAVPVARHTRIIAVYPKAGAISPFRVPAAAADWLEAHQMTGNVFNSIRYGGYLLWRFYPAKKVYIDGRLTVRPPRFFDEYLALLDNPSHFEQTARRFNITNAVLPTAVFYQYMGIVKWLYDSPRWKLVFADGASVVFVRSDLFEDDGLDVRNGQDVRRMEAEIDRQWRNDAYIRREARTYLAQMIRYLAPD